MIYHHIIFQLLMKPLALHIRYQQIIFTTMCDLIKMTKNSMGMLRSKYLENYLSSSNLLAKVGANSNIE